MQNNELYKIYYCELLALSKSIIEKCELVFEKTSRSTERPWFLVSFEVHSLIASLLSDAANIGKLVAKADDRKKDESQAAFEIRKDRTKELSGFLCGVGVVEMLNRKVRNTIEHFDEYMDETICKVSRDDSPSGYAAYNIVASHLDSFSPHVYPIKLYVSSERKYYNLKWVVDIGVIYQEAVDIKRKVCELPMFISGNPLGMLLPLR